MRGEHIRHDKQAGEAWGQDETDDGWVSSPPAGFVAL